MASGFGISRRTILYGACSTVAAFPVRAAEAKEVTIAVSSTSFVLAGMLMAQQSGIFEKNGVKPRIVVMDSGNAAISALLGGSAQFTVAGPPEVLAARTRGQPIVIVANLYQGLAGSLILSKATAGKLGSRADAPIDERLKALNGLTIAVPSATSSLLGPVRTAAVAAGAQIKFTYMAQPAMPAALESGAIDGMIASFPFAGTPILRGTGVLWINGPGGELPADAEPSSSSCLQTSEQFAKAEPDTISRLQKTIADTAVFVKQHSAEAKAALAKAYPALKPEEIELAFDQQHDNWTKPFLTEADLRQEVKLLRGSVNLPGLDTIDLSTLLIGPRS